MGPCWHCNASDIGRRRCFHFNINFTPKQQTGPRTQKSYCQRRDRDRDRGSNHGARSWARQYPSCRSRPHAPLVRWRCQLKQFMSVHIRQPGSCKPCADPGAPVAILSPPSVALLLLEANTEVSLLAAAQQQQEK